MNTGYYGRCGGCGEVLPPPSASAHTCNWFYPIPAVNMTDRWSELAIRAIVRDVMREELEQRIDAAIRSSLGKSE